MDLIKRNEKQSQYKEFRKIVDNVSKLDLSLHKDTINAIEQRMWTFLDPETLSNGPGDHLKVKNKFIAAIFDKCTQEAVDGIDARIRLETVIDDKIRNWHECT